jgi:tRNA (cytidine/uridine-2'-O-)-methyltransferase
MQFARLAKPPLSLQLGVMRLALFQPDIPQNTGAILRLAACAAIGVDIIEPCGFVLSDTRMRRAGMDYLERAEMVRHRSWRQFRETCTGRLIVVTTGGTVPYIQFRFDAHDTLLFGQESAGVPPEVHDAAAARLAIPMAPGLRSLNVALAAAMVLGEALRQTDGFPVSDRNGDDDAT